MVDESVEPVRIGLIGKYVQLPDAYLSVVESLKHAGFHHGAKVEIDWIQAEDVEGLLAAGRLGELDGIVIPGGFGERGFEGKIAAAGYAREHGVPCLGLCLGLQAMTIEYARNVLHLTGANSSEMDPTTAVPGDRPDARPARRHRQGRHAAARRVLRDPRGRQPGGQGLRRAGGQRAPPPPLRAEQPVEAAPRGRRAALQRDVAGPPAGRVHRGASTTRSGSAPRPTRSSSPAPIAPTRCSASWSARRSPCGPRKQAEDATPEDFAAPRQSVA